MSPDLPVVAGERRWRQLSDSMLVWVSDVRAWAPGIETPAAWSIWSDNPCPVTSDERPAAADVPAMTRRRLTRWGRQALEVAGPCAKHLSAETPVIFSSRHGDTQRTLSLLESLAAGQTLSPNAFSLSVHNSALGLFTILHELQMPSVALAAGRETLAQAWIEAVTHLATGAPRVLLVHTDEPLGGPYTPFADEIDMPASVALVLERKPVEGAVPVSLRCEADTGADDERSMLLAFLAWWFSFEPQMRYRTGGTTWSWGRRDYVV